VSKLLFHWGSGKDVHSPVKPTTKKVAWHSKVAERCKARLGCIVSSTHASPSSARGAYHAETRKNQA